VNELLSLDTQFLPTPRSIKVSAEGGGETRVRLAVDLATISAARKWAAALGIALKDTDPRCRYITQRQESGSLRIGQLWVQVIGTEPVPYGDWDARLSAQAASRIAAEAAVSS
jgi:hypothetical protein